MTKTTRAWYTLEFKQEAVRLVEGGQSIAATARMLGVVANSKRTMRLRSRSGVPGSEPGPVLAPVLATHDQIEFLAE